MRNLISKEIINSFFATLFSEKLINILLLCIVIHHHIICVLVLHVELLTSLCNRSGVMYIRFKTLDISGCPVTVFMNYAPTITAGYVFITLSPKNNLSLITLPPLTDVRYEDNL